MPNTQGPLCHTYGIRGFGDPSYGVVLVGIAPGRDEVERTHRPFTGASGRLLDQLLEFSGWSRDRVYTTNTICWWNNKPSPEEIEQCGVRFRHEITDLKPKLIITAGEIANTTVMGTKRRSGSRGSVVWSDYWKAYVLDTHHPSFALQAQSMSAVQDIIRDLSKIERVVDWPPNGEGAKVSYRVVESLPEANSALRVVPRDGRIVTLDIETSNPDVEAIDPYKDQLLTFAISYDTDDGHETTIVFPTRIFPECVRSGRHVVAQKCECGLPKHPLDFPLDANWTFQYGQADIPGIYQYFGVMLPLKNDTLLMSVCTDERPGYHGLKLNAREWLGAGWYEAEVKKYYKGRMGLLAPETVESYNAKDAAYTKRLVTVHTQHMQEDDTERLYRDLLLPATQTFIPMQIRGIKVDQTALQQLAYENWFPRFLSTYRDLQLEAMDIGWLTDDFNINSTPQMRKLFYNLLGEEPIKLTKAGLPSLDKEVLDQMDHPFAAKIRAFRQLDTMIDYVLAVYQHLKYDGLLHPQAYVSTTRTGRTSYRDPAMQTIPKDYTVGSDYARIREVFTPHNPDTHELIEADYNQIEVWIAWAWSRDPVLLEHLMSGDVHSATAEGAFKTKRELHSKADWDRMRQNAKKIRFGLQYGEGAKKLATPPPVGIGGTVQAAQVYVNNYKHTYPVYTRWMLSVQQEALDKGFLRLPSGRVMRFPVVMDHKALRQAINFPIQGVASEYNLTSMIELGHPYDLYEASRALRALNSWILLNIHDCLVIESDRRYRDEVIALVREVMEKPRFPGFPSVKVDVKVGDNMGSMKKV